MFRRLVFMLVVAMIATSAVLMANMAIDDNGGLDEYIDDDPTLSQFLSTEGKPNLSCSPRGTGGWAGEAM